MTLADHQVLRPELAWTGTTFEAGWTVEVDGDGRIVSAGPADSTESAGDDANPFADEIDLRGRALLPGFVNAHSHAFQRGLRGLGETFPKGAGSFWTWREAMYSLVGRLDETLLYDLTHQAFREMLAAGITSVGEFHYVHHLHDLTRSFAGDAVVLQAARDAGIRVVLLQACYRFGGLLLSHDGIPEKGRPLSGGQLRFDTRDFDTYLQSIDRLEGLLHRDLPEGQTLGIVAHSIRAVAEDDLRRLHALARERGWVFHMHVEEQRQEIEDCLEVYGKTPMQVVLDACDADERTTAVHCTHTTPADMARYLGTGANVCLCPLTEANLGDGIADLPGILQAGASQLCLGSDSNARISMLEEMRWTEYVQRLQGERRGVAVDDEGRLAPRLLEAATVGGARALGLDTGRIETGALADFVTVDLGHPQLAHTTPETLADALVCGGGDGVIERVCVGGRWVGPSAAP